MDTSTATSAFTPKSGADNSGYVVPLENPMNGVNYRGFGRSVTLGELAFVFICTADPIDTMHSGTSVEPKGTLRSNDIATNRTLAGLTAPLSSNQRRVQMMILPKLFSPSLGDMQMRPKWIRITIAGLNGITLSGQSLFDVTSGILKTSDLNFNGGTSRRSLGGEYDYRSLLVADQHGINDAGILDTAASPDKRYPFISKFVTVTVSNPPGTVAAGYNNQSGLRQPGMMPFNFTTALTVTIESSADGLNFGNNTPQTFTIIPPAGMSSSVPIPNLVRTASTTDGANNIAAADPQYWWAFSYSSPTNNAGSQGRLANLTDSAGFFRVLNGVNNASGTSSWTTLPPSSGTTALRGSLLREADNINGTAYYTDVVRSMVPAHGDMRLICALDNVPAGVFTRLGAPVETANPTVASDPWSSNDAKNALLHQLMIGSSQTSAVPGSPQSRRHFVYANPVVYPPATGPTYGLGGFSPPMFRNDDPTSNATNTAVINAVAKSGDFDTGTVYWPDGAYINKPDEGNVFSDPGFIPYFTSQDSEYLDSKNFFSPNRMIPGPGMLGSLPTHVKRYANDINHPENHAWRTLLFRNQPTHPDAVALTSGGLPTSGSAAPDHLLMDLFWMPTIEPYAISEPFSTAGKVNMNYQLQPFTYIKRQTGMYAVLDREKVVAVPTNDYPRYKVNGGTTPSTNTVSPPNASLIYRTPIDPKVTLEQFDTRFSDASGRIFLSPTELCDQWLVPQNESVNSMATFWASHALTGDHMRERPYTTIIPRLTTKSNTFTVHCRVQVLKSPASVNAATWEEAKGLITSEYRGSTTIQRFVNLYDSELQGTDFTSATTTKTLDDFVRWRVINTRQFAP